MSKREQSTYEAQSDEAWQKALGDEIKKRPSRKPEYQFASDTAFKNGAEFGREYRQKEYEHAKSSAESHLKMLNAALAEVQHLRQLLIERNKNAVLAVENYNRINGLVNEAHATIVRLADALEWIAENHTYTLGGISTPVSLPKKDWQDAAHDALTAEAEAIARARGGVK